MRILVAHSRYRYPGGEETVFEQETALLRAAGHDVIVHDRSNWEAAEFSLLKKVTLPKRVIWSEEARQQIRDLLRKTQPDIAHFHNTHYMLSPSVYSACREADVPVVQSLHNPRLMCPASTLVRDGRLCEDCVGKNPPWPGVLHGCYRDSRLQTAVVAAMLVYHRWRQTWQTHVDTFIVFTEFFRRKFIEIGLPADRLVLKPHFVSPDPGPRVFDPAAPGSYALYVGRLAPEKGVYPLLHAWESLEVPLKIRGGGPLLAEAEAAAHRSAWIEMVGRLERAALFDLLKGSRFLVWPSEGNYETFGMVAVEALACGIPLIASRTGVGAHLITDQQTGLHFAAGDAADLAAKVRWAWDHPAEMVEMGRNARREFEARYTAARNLEMLEDIYRQTIERYAKSHAYPVDSDR